MALFVAWDISIFVKSVENQLDYNVHSSCQENVRKNDESYLYGMMPIVCVVEHEMSQCRCGVLTNRMLTTTPGLLLYKPDKRLS